MAKVPMEEDTFQPILVSIGDIVGDHYKVIHSLGKSEHFETFLALNLAYKFLVDVRVYYKSPKIAREAKANEDFMTIANTIDLDHRYFVKFLGNKEQRGIPFLFFQHTGPTLEEQYLYFNGLTFSLNTIKTFMWQLLHALELLHESKIISGSLSMSSVSFVGDYVDENGYEKKSGSRSIQIRINSLENATSGSQWHIQSNTPMKYRAPEAIIGTRWSYEVDLWALGIIFVELVTGIKLFETKNHIEHLAMIEKLGGPFPVWLLSESSSTYITDFIDGHVDTSSLSKEEKERIDEIRPLDEMFKSESLLSFAQQLLATDPSQRASPTALFDHPFIQEV